MREDVDWLTFVQDDLEDAGALRLVAQIIAVAAMDQFRSSGSCTVSSARSIFRRGRALGTRI